MIFGTNGNYKSPDSISKIKKDIKELEVEVEDNTNAINDLDTDLQEYKQTVATQQSSQNTQINANKNSIENLEEYTENYVEQNKSLIETQVLRATEYVETPLVRTPSIQMGEVDLNEKLNNIDTSIENIETDTNDIHENLNTIKQVNDIQNEDIKTLFNGMTPVLDNGNLILPYARILPNGAILQSKINDFYQDPAYIPEQGNVYNIGINIFVTNVTNIGYKSYILYDVGDLGSYKVSDVKKILETELEIFEWMRSFSIGTAIVENFSNDSNKREAQEKINSGIIIDMKKITLEDIQNVQFSSLLPITLYFYTEDDKIYENANGVIRECADDEILSNLATIACFLSYHEYTQFFSSTSVAVYGRTYGRNSDTEDKTFLYWERN